MKEITPKEKKLLKKARIKELMEVYGTLLSDKERKVLTLFTDPALTGAAIAKRLKISRQAVHDHIRRGVNKMERCDAKTNMLEKRQKKMKIIADMEGILSKQTLEENDIKELTRLVSSLKKLE